MRMPDSGMNDARLAFESGDPATALARVDRSWLIYGHQGASFLKGQILLALGRREDALACYWAALAVNPRNAKFGYGLAALLAESDDASEAREVLDAALTANPEHGPSRRLLTRLQQGATSSSGRTCESM